MNEEDLLGFSNDLKERLKITRASLQACPQVTQFWLSLVNMPTNLYRELWDIDRNLLQGIVLLEISHSSGYRRNLVSELDHQAIQTVIESLTRIVRDSKHCHLVHNASKVVAAAMFEILLTEVWIENLESGVSGVQKYMPLPSMVQFVSRQHKQPVVELQKFVA